MNRGIKPTILWDNGSLMEQYLANNTQQSTIPYIYILVCYYQNFVDCPECVYNSLATLSEFCV